MVDDALDGRDKTLLCLSHLRWNFVYQRPQHLLTRAADDHAVYFLEEPVFKADVAPHLDVHPTPDGVTVVVPVLPEGLPASSTSRAQRTLLDQLLAEIRPKHLTAWYYTPAALAFSRHIETHLCVYDNMDELSAFRGASPRLLTYERELLRRADLVFTGGHSLFEAKRGRHHAIHAFPSSVDTAHFARARNASRAEMPEQADLPRPRIGFFGVIDERMDLALVEAIAEREPSWSIVMIGPVVKIDPDTLPRRPNIHWIGSKAYRDLPAYLAGWDVGIMPFALNEATRFISPTKTPEFLAAGVPVVSTPIADVVRPYGERGLVEIAATAEAFVSSIHATLARSREGASHEAWLREADTLLASMSWDKTWAEMQALMRTARQRPAHPTSATTAETAHV
jgi:glycosyltransferase involved in cell wall biosynthesis